MHDAASIIRKSPTWKSLKAAQRGQVQPAQPRSSIDITPSELGTYGFCPQAHRIKMDGYNPTTAATRKGDKFHAVETKQAESAHALRGLRAAALVVLLILIGIMFLVVMNA